MEYVFIALMWTGHETIMTVTTMPNQNVCERAGKALSGMVYTGQWVEYECLPASDTERKADGSQRQRSPVQERR